MYSRPRKLGDFFRSEGFIWSSSTISWSFLMAPTFALPSLPNLSKHFLSWSQPDSMSLAASCISLTSGCPPWPSKCLAPLVNWPFTRFLNASSLLLSPPGLKNSKTQQLYAERFIKAEGLHSKWIHSPNFGTLSVAAVAIVAPAPLRNPRRERSMFCTPVVHLRLCLGGVLYIVCLIIGNIILRYPSIVMQCFRNLWIDFG